MCGFVGCFGERPEGKRREAALDAITHRGPDDHGVFQDGHGWLGFRRLSILDPSPAGHQPMVFGDGRYALVFNGEIYNHRELRERLLGGVPHRSSGDTEVLGQLLERMPVEEILPELRGMFAFIWYDTLERTVTAARDRFGIKPLYYSPRGKGVSFSSELKALLALHPERELSPEGVRSYLASGSVSSPHSIFQSICCLPPGHLLRYGFGTDLRVKEWHQLKWQEPGAWMKGGMPEWREAVRETVLDSIRAHLVSDVEVGVFLSGGLDSTLVACAMHHLGHPKLKAFSVGYEQDAGIPDESGTAERTARHLGASFDKEVITSGGLHDAFDDYIRVMDQPTGDALNTYLAARVAARSVKVAMSGVGIDEWFGGYTYHKALIGAKAAGMMSRPARMLMPLFSSLLGDHALGGKIALAGKAGYLARLLDNRDVIGIQATARRFFTEGEMLLQGGCREDGDGPFSRHQLEVIAPGSFHNQLFALETATFLQNTLLRDADWASMAHSLELRTPFVDEAIFELAAKLPPEAKLTPTSCKRVIRECFTDILPQWIVDDRKKKTFTLPKAQWMREPVWKHRIQDVLRSASFRGRGFIAEASVGPLLDEFYLFQGGRSDSFVTYQKIWLLFILEEWLRAHVDA